jgi:hypothetical protein
MGAPSRLRLIRKAAALARIDETCDLTSIEEKPRDESGREVFFSFSPIRNCGQRPGEVV